MTDITACGGEGCPLKEDCYRFKCKRDEYQSYFTEVPYKGGECEYIFKRKIC